jgi:two-component system, NarL family, nitrate/nitrite sensor histidine kinase NarX
MRMNFFSKNPLSMKMGLMMATIIILACTSMLTSLFITDTMKGLAKAINKSGSLRMRSYQIATNLVHDPYDEQEHWTKTHQLIVEFEAYLYSDNLTSVIQRELNHHPMNQVYKRIVRQWLIEVKPLFETYLDGIKLDGIKLDGIKSHHSTPLNKFIAPISDSAVISLRNQYLQVVGKFVERIDLLVSLIEDDTEKKVKNLQLLQYISLAMTLLLVITTLFMMHIYIKKPLNQLLLGAKHVQNNDFSYRLTDTKNNELGRLGIAFNAMSEELAKVYTELEDRVIQKTLQLEQTNSSLQLLYKTVNQLNSQDASSQTYLNILNYIEKYADISGGAICLGNDNDNLSSIKASMLATTFKNKYFFKQICFKNACQECFIKKKFQSIDVDSTEYNDQNELTHQEYLSFPIKTLSQQYGVLIIESKKNQNIAKWQQQLLKNIADHLAISIKLSLQSAEISRDVLREERNTMARELHDSLAQSLTFMKIQVSRLQNIAKKKNEQFSSNNLANMDDLDNRGDEKQIISELKYGINSAYKELRELLTTFRLKIEGKQFNKTLLNTVQEFDQRSDCQIYYDNQLGYTKLTPNEEVHILQLIREALSNIVQHAHASLASVVLKYTPVGEIQININDNGKNNKNYEAERHHYGLVIMKERANHLGGELELSNLSGEGCHIQLIFTPTNQISPQQLKENSHS